MLESRRQYICTGRGRSQERKGTSKYGSSEGDTPLPFVCGKSLSLNYKGYLAMDIMVTNLDYII